MAVDLRDQIRRFYKEVMENRNTSVIDELTTEDYVEHEIPQGLTLPPGRDGIKALMKVYLDAFSEMHIEVHDVIQDRDCAAAFVTFHATHRGELMGIAATGKRVSVPMVDWIRFEGERAAEHWGVGDNLVLMQQLGVIPA